MAYEILLTDAEERAVLAACRGLSNAGYRVAAVGHTRFAASHWSRSCGRRLMLPDPCTDQLAYVDALCEVLSSHEYAVVLPGTEPSLIAVSAQRERIERYASTGLPSPKVVDRSLDKVCLLEAIAVSGLDAPPTFVCSNADEAAEASRELGFPVLVKPARSFGWAGQTLRRQFAAASYDEASARAAALTMQGRFLVQRFEPVASVVSCSGVYAGGLLQVHTTARYRRTWPVASGSAALAKTVPLPDELQQKVELLLDHLGWQGIFELEFLERQDGSLTPIDFNPRLFGWIALAIAAGSNLPAVWCDWLLQRSSSVRVPRLDLWYRWEEGEALHLLWQLRRRRLRSASAVLRPRRHVTHAYFKVTDPLPLIARMLNLTGLRHRRLARGNPRPN
jgi:predicted ATP-grasp superfamily ATP-dependent carboligase